MRIIIVGAGRTGTQLVRHLVQEKHDVSLIESDEERARHASNRLDCLVLHDEGNSLAALEEAGIARADALVCVTDSDEVNMIICGLAASRYPGLLKIARVRNDDYVRINQHILEKGEFSSGSGHPLAAGRNSPPLKEKETGEIIPPEEKKQPKRVSKSSGTGKKGAFFEDPRILGIDYFVHPDVEAARAILRSLSHGALGNILEFAGTSYELGSIDVGGGSSFDGLSIKDYRSLVKEDSLVTLLERDTGSSPDSSISKEDSSGESLSKGISSPECLLPAGSTVLKKGDRVHILAKEAEMEHIFHLAGRREKPLRRVGIVGGGRIGVLVAEGILGRSEENGQAEKKKTSLFSMFRSFMPKSSRRVIIVEKNYGVCKELAARFPEALVLNEDISDESFVAEERLGDLDLIITATENQELNMIAALYLKSRGVTRAIAMVTGSGYETIARHLGVDVVISMQSVVVDTILSSLMGKGIKGLHRLGDGTVEILEARIHDESPVLEKPITEFKLSEGGLIMLVNRGEASFIPRGDYVFKAGDKVIFIAKNGSEAELEKIFGIQNQN